ncbi:MAG: hypothetical protein IJE22_04570 [Oscillibacter sp.]|nr:hypothetical protein [Oscillibacter sp.]MBQ2996493.1 hypothetical protein [Oscillibacter sp.]
MKKLICICLVLLLLSGCSAGFVCENEYYRIYRENGKTYMEFLKEYTPEDRISTGPGWLSAVSVRELKSDILNGRLSGLHLFTLRNLSDGQRLEVIDPETLHEPALPENVTCESVTWAGDRCSFRIESNVGCGYADILFRDEFAERFHFYYSWEVGHENDDMVEERNVPERNALYSRFIAYTPTAYGSYRSDTHEYLRYCIATRQGNVFVVEEHKNGYDGLILYPSEEEPVPEKVHLFCESPEGYLAVTLDVLRERPSVEWLAAFGVK